MNPTPLTIALALGSLVFVARAENIDIWILPLDADRARPTGALTRLTSDPAVDQRPSLSADGRRIAWETSRGGNFEVWIRDLVSGEEKAVTSGPLREHTQAEPRGDGGASDLHARRRKRNRRSGKRSGAPRGRRMAAREDHDFVSGEVARIQRSAAPM